MTVEAAERLRGMDLIDMCYRRIAATSRTADVSFTTTETVGDEISAYMVAGYKYKIMSYQLCRSSVANDSITVRLREDSLTGTELQSIRVHIPIISTVFVGYLERLYTASETGLKTIVTTGVRASGSGSSMFSAALTQLCWMAIDYVPSGF